MTAPERIQAIRWRCPHCGRSRSSRSATVEHMARCWYNPAARSCKTCVHFEEGSDGCFDDPSCNCASGESCRKGLEVDVLTKNKRTTFPTDCPLWEFFDRDALIEIEGAL